MQEDIAGVDTASFLAQIAIDYQESCMALATSVERPIFVKGKQLVKTVSPLSRSAHTVP